ncbi:response regulator [Planktothrix sp. FACHB-1355]|uniref:Response regulator n=1 Tax=Aerosakkonema funiforme FACHB-1375 TaxID=2949571 RepID=A0A926ZHS7_9CYAN|nr:MULTISPECIES: response regulator [Oscillatoriales]MBD2182949.1 response regulator [Aerosakkonema funiforme FACHB-1375]MBD3559318.1 response regulator [Planktothrix sp. FACHB-1355]
MATILVVEDSITEAQFICNSLREVGLNTITVNTAEAAKVIVSQKKIDAILLDVVLPGESGFGFCRKLKSEDKTSHIPIIICSSKNGKIDQTWGLKQGASAYLTKPLDREELLQTVQRFIQS